MKTRYLFLLVSFALISCINVQAQTTESYKNWEQKLDSLLPLYGHRNWIVVVDMAYPLQSKTGLTALYTGENQIKIVEKVFWKIKEASHISANIYLDKEIDFIGEKNAIGIETYREELETIIGKEARKILHEDLIKKLDNAAEMYQILILKTNMTLPYTSVFFELECGYWDTERENILRKNLK